MKPIIEVRNLSKQYKIGQKQKYLSLRDSITGFFKNKRQREESDFWALDDVSFDVQAGESIGIIGRNGAGKSTLLKILSRITPPTKGKVILRGRMASLLEVGTGFHPELTGRENVYFNASILGLRKAEVNKKFDEIVAFSGVEQFIDTPLKHYSSGMQLRLAFAVAAHLEPEILVIDEVLAVGDAEFQKKCLGKMDEVSKSGRTVLFVSHNMGAVQNLCKNSLWLDKGKIMAVGATNQIINQYLSVGYSSKQFFSNNSHKAIYFKSIEILDEYNNLKSSFTTDESIIIKIELVQNQPLPSTDFILFIQSVIQGKRLFIIEKNTEIIFDKEKNTPSSKFITITLPHNFLMPGSYACEIGILASISEYIDWHESVGTFEVVFGNNKLMKYGERELGYVFPHYNIRIE